jgi:hypothetical protein
MKDSKKRFYIVLFFIFSLFFSVLIFIYFNITNFLNKKYEYQEVLKTYFNNNKELRCFIFEKDGYRKATKVLEEFLVIKNINNLKLEENEEFLYFLFNDKKIMLIDCQPKEVPIEIIKPAYNLNIKNNIIY